MIREIPIVESKNIGAVSYDDETMELFVQFKSGLAYRYTKVTGDVADGFSQAVSSGDYFNLYVRGNFEFGKISS